MDSLTTILIWLGIIFIVIKLIRRFVLKPEIEAQKEIKRRLQSMDMWCDVKKTVIDNGIIPIEEIPAIEKKIALLVKMQLNREGPKDPRELVEIYYACMFNACATACGKTDKEFMSMFDDLDRQRLAHNSSNKQ